MQLIKGVFMKKLVEDIVLICILCIVAVVCRKIVIDKVNSNDIGIVNQATYDVDVESNNDMLYLMTDEYARNDMVADNIKISSNSNNSSDYKLYLRLDNNSTLDDDSLKVLVNDKEYKLSDLYDYEVDGYRYYYIYNDEIDKVDNISFKLWLSNSLVDDIVGDSLIYKKKLYFLRYNLFLLFAIVFNIHNYRENNWYSSCFF